MRTKLRKGLFTPFVALAVAAGTASAVAADQVILAYPQAVSVTNADIGYGIQLGLFAEEGLEVKMIGLEGSARMIPQVANGSVTAAFAHPDYMLSALDKGQVPPAKFVYNWRRRSPYEIAVLDGSAIRSVADLKGRKIGIGALTWSNVPMVRAVLRDNGIELGKDAQLVPIGTGPAAWKQLQSGAVDAIAYYTAEHEKIIAAGTPLRRLDFGKYGRMFTNGLIMSNETIEKNPDLVRRLGRAIAKTTVACKANPEACVKGAWTLDPTLKPADDKQDEWIRKYLPLQDANYLHMLTFEPGEPELFGAYPADGWRTHVEVMHGAGILKNASLPVEQIYTSEFVADFNEFDRAALEARSRGAH
ncbi:MAG TPA: ABC transporter substrate-binding protein [Zeimonas sp.]|nr:ABC transporter substrate-binding protein [Zeimonas sp.]